MSQQQKGACPDRVKRVEGFTIIELIVVIAIIAVLAGIVLVNVTQYINNAKVARAHVEADNIATALSAFYAAHGSYPYNNNQAFNCPGEGCLYIITAEPGKGEAEDAEGNSLLDFYNLTWNDYNAEYIGENGKYEVYIEDTNDDQVIDKISILLTSDEGIYGCKTMMGSPDLCVDTPFQATPY